ncbi:AAA family ATPase [Enterobacter sp. CM29]|uniref:VirB4 family type IV secretion system protein n=1 Tax=Enterobacter sp. CM29 TaxID=2738449 RepID=UPI0015C56023|nr:AAA family ATPase [Enterobacter sp. CM29]NQD63304.1 AAA family ATPase [Enterobacter sp. CM29]
MPSKTFNEQLNLAGHNDGCVYTYHGTVIGGLQLTGLDPTFVTEQVRKSVSAMLRNIFQLLPAEITLTEYYLHYEGVKVKLADRDNPRSQLLSKRRQAYLNKVRNLNGSRLCWLVEMKPDENINSVFSLSFAKNLFNSFFDADSRKRVGLAFKNHDAFMIEIDEYRKQCRKLQETLSDLNVRLSFFSPENTEMDVNGIWRLQKFLANFNTSYLTSKPCPTPKYDWDQYTLDGEHITNITIEGVPMLKIDGAQPVYVRIASVIKHGQDAVPESVWAYNDGDKKPVLMSGNYVIFNRFMPVKGLKRSLMITARENELFRAQISFADLMTAKVNSERSAAKIKENPHLKKMQDELLSASNSPDTMGHYQSAIAVFDTDPHKLIEASKEVNRIVSNNTTLVWESVGLERAYYAMQPGYPKNTYRSMVYYTSQAGAAALFYKSHEGIKEWKRGFDTEEAIYIFESEDGVPFHYTSVIGEKNLIIGVGPTRSGKSFAKNVIASHFTKLGGLYSSLDVDAGTIPLANFFKEDAAAFSLSEGVQNGVNPFVSAHNEKDNDYISHLINQLKLMLRFNEREEDKYFSPDEVNEIAQNIKNLLVQEFSEIEGRLSTNTLSTLMAKCSSRIKDKLAAFYGTGHKANLFDCEVDAIGKLDKPLTVYNLASVKDQKQEAQLMQREIFFRTVRLFESQKYRDMPKFMDIDEAQYTLSVKGAAEWAIAKSRTWFKHGGGMGFWTQSPGHYKDLPEWETLRSAASVFMFMCDQEPNVKQYVDTFGISEDQVDIIRNLVPRRQIYIVIPEARIAKVVNLNVESEQYAICTSTAHEASLAHRIYQETDDIDEAIDRIVEGLSKPKTPAESDRDLETMYL